MFYLVYGASGDTAMLEYLSIVSLIAAGFAVYYSRDIAEKVKNRFFELKEETEESFDSFQSLRKELQESLVEINEKIKKLGAMERTLESSIKKLERVDDLEQRLSSVESLIEELQNQIQSIRSDLEHLRGELQEVRTVQLSDDIKEKLKRELLGELEEEIERLEELIEKRKEEEVNEFLELLKTGISLEPEKIGSGLREAKRALLSLRDIAKVYVLTERGVEEFRELKENLVQLLRNLRKLFVIAVPDENAYSRFRDVIIEVKRLELPMRDEKGRELNPERTFIRIHHMVYRLAGELDELAEMVNEPIPVTPIEKEFYEKLRLQFEELRRLEAQVNELMSKLGGKVTLEESKARGKDELEKLLKELDL